MLLNMNFFPDFRIPINRYLLPLGVDTVHGPATILIMSEILMFSQSVFMYGGRGGD